MEQKTQKRNILSPCFPCCQTSRASPPFVLLLFFIFFSILQPGEEGQAGGRGRMCELHLICPVTSQDSLFSLRLWGNKSRDTAWPLTGFIQTVTAWWMDQESLITLQTLAFIPPHTLLSKVGPCVFILKGLFFLHKWRKDPFSPEVFVFISSRIFFFLISQPFGLERVPAVCCADTFPLLSLTAEHRWGAWHSTFLVWISGTSNHLKEIRWWLVPRNQLLRTLGAGCCQEHWKALPYWHQNVTSLALASSFSPFVISRNRNYIL